MMGIEHDDKATVANLLAAARLEMALSPAWRRLDRAVDLLLLAMERMQNDVEKKKGDE